MDRLHSWKSIAMRELDSTDPRFEMDPFIPTVIAGEAYQKAVAEIVLGRFKQARASLAKVWVAARSKIEGVRAPDYTDMIYWFLTAWLTEEEKDRPNPWMLIKALHEQIVNELEKYGNSEAIEMYRKVADYTDFDINKRLRPSSGASVDEKFYTRMGRRYLNLTKLWLLDDLPGNTETVGVLLDCSGKMMENARKKIIQNLNLKEIDLTYIREGDMDILRRSDSGRYLVYKEYRDWEDNPYLFYKLQSKTALGFVDFLNDRTDEKAKKARQSLDALFQEARNPDHPLFAGLDVIEQSLWAYLGARWLIRGTSRKPFNVLKYYLKGSPDS